MNELRVWIDGLLGRITMYRLVTYGLITISLFALAVMFTGSIAYSPAAFVISIVISVGASYGMNRLFGWLFNVRPYAESAIITGLILALLFTPPVSVLAGVKLLLVVTIASLSKYVIAVRGKHVFNPAAIAIVIASVSGLAFATWWVATPVLLPVTIIVALLVLYKTEKLQVGATFVIVAVVLLLIQAIQHGQTSGTELLSVLTSWPLIFIAGIMLTEPLTLAPRRSQQLVVAIIVGVLVTLDIHYGRISMTPALALVIGNAVSFIYTTRKAIKLRLVSVKRYAHDGYEFLFDTNKPDFLPGQYIELSLPHKRADSRGIRRVFSIVGHPGEEQLSIATRIPEKSSSFKRSLLALSPGDVVRGTRVAGDFVLPQDKAAPILCIAGGIGITPFLSFLQSNSSRKLTILYVVTKISDFMFIDQMRQYDAEVIVVSPDDGKLPYTEWTHEKSVLTSDVIKKYASASGYTYISGPPAMVDRAKAMSEQAGAQHIHTDQFSGY